MYRASKITASVAGIICYLLIVLFTYAAVSKLIDLEKFRIQIGQSPITANFAGSLSVAIPSIELIIVGLLVSTRLRIVGLFLSSILMILFTAYIYIILNFSDSIPCSCGGVLQLLSWKTHLIFNATFVVFSIIGCVLQYRIYPDPATPKKILLQ